MTLIPVAKIMADDTRHARRPFAAAYDRGSAHSGGRCVPITEATVPMLDQGFFHADAAYDVVSVSRGQFFRLDDHLARMERSCAKFMLESPLSRAATADVLHELVRLTGFADAYVWWGVTRGLPQGPRGDASQVHPNFYAFVAPYVWQIDEATRLRGVDLVVSDFVRIPPKSVDPTAKNFHWMDMKLALYTAKMGGADWAVLTDGAGNITEGPGVNIFLVKDGALVTPDAGCLEGVTRQTTLDLARELGLPVQVRTVSVAELRAADEAFLTSSAGGIMPVRSVDGTAFADNKPGPVSTQLHNQYWERRWDGWLGTPVRY